MKFSVDSKSLVDLLGRAKKVHPKVTEVNIVGAKKGAFMVVSSDTATAKFRIANIEVEDSEDPITVPLDTLLSSIRNRKILNFETSDGQLNFNDGAKYKGHITIPAYNEVDLLRPTGGTEIDLSDETAGVFHDVVESATLSGEFGNTEGMILNLHLGKHGITALCYDPYYIASVTDSSAKFDDEQSVAISTNVIALATQVAGKNAYKLILTEDAVYAYNSEFMLRQAAIQNDGVEETLASIAESIEEWLGMDATKVTADLGKFKEVLDNMSAFYERGVPIQFTVAKKGVEIRIDGNGGEIAERVDGETENPAKEAFRCEFQLLSELLPKVPGPTVEMAFIPERMVYFNRDDGVRRVFMSAALVSE